MSEEKRWFVRVPPKKEKADIKERCRFMRFKFSPKLLDVCSYPHGRLDRENPECKYDKCPLKISEKEAKKLGGGKLPRQRRK